MFHLHFSTKVSRISAIFLIITIVGSFIPSCQAMSYSKLSWAAAMVRLASALPQISLPPLIPSIPGVTTPLGAIVPPLPVLQVPTPPLDSPSHAVNTTLHPKKIGHFWAGAGDKNHKDFLASYSLDDATFGTLLHIADVPSSGNEPHHSGKR